MASVPPTRESQPQPEKLRFSTRVDRWLAVVIAVYVLVAVGLPAWHLGNVVSGNTSFDPVMGLLPLVIFGLLWLVTVPCRYEFIDKALVARSGIIRFSVPLLAITRVRRTWNPMSAPAWSLRRLEIHYGKTQQLLISPENEDAFLQALEARAPQLEWVGDELVVARAWLDAERKVHANPPDRGH